MSRPDLKQVILPQFLDQLFQIIKDEKKSGNNIKLLGALKCLSSIYKYGKREDILKYTLSTLKTIIEQDLLASSQLAIIRKFHIKIVQRIGITFFKLKVAKWRYERGSRVLMEKINAKQDFQIKKKQDIENDDDEQIPGEIEDIIEQLLTGLKGKFLIFKTKKFLILFILLYKILIQLFVGQLPKESVELQIDYQKKWLMIFYHLY
jgi:tubulin-specific chaperone D